MAKLIIPPLLTQEFATVEAVWNSPGSTRRVDSLLLSWVKYEKQLRRLFCFIVFQHSGLTPADIESVVGILAANNKLYPETFITGIEELSARKVAVLAGPRYAALWARSAARGVNDSTQSWLISSAQDCYNPHAAF